MLGAANISFANAKLLMSHEPRDHQKHPGSTQKSYSESQGIPGLKLQSQGMQSMHPNL